MSLRPVFWSVAVLTAAGALVLGGCSGNSAPAPAAAAPISKSETPGAVLRTTLDTLLRENVVLSADASNAALGTRFDEFREASTALDANGQELAAAIGAIYGKDTQDKFMVLWRNHDGYLVDYTQGVATNDSGKRDKAISDLIGYAQDLAGLLDDASGGRLKKDATTDLLKTNFVGIKGVIDAQALKDYATAYTRERDAERQAESIGNILANAIVDQYPDRY